MTNLYKVVIGALFTLCFIYAVDNPTPNHVKRNWLTWEESIEWKMSLLGVPISYVYIYATKDLVEAFNGDLWPQRLIGFSMGMLAFAFLTWIHFHQAITLKTAVTLALAIAIVVIQIVWK